MVRIALQNVYALIKHKSDWIPPIPYLYIIPLERALNELSFGNFIGGVISSEPVAHPDRPIVGWVVH